MYVIKAILWTRVRLLRSRPLVLLLVHRYKSLPWLILPFSPPRFFLRLFSWCVLSFSCQNSNTPSYFHSAILPPHHRYLILINTTISLSPLWSCYLKCKPLSTSCHSSILYFSLYYLLLFNMLCYIVIYFALYLPPIPPPTHTEFIRAGLCVTDVHYNTPAMDQCLLE
jgi:hypothetical protein